METNDIIQNLYALMNNLGKLNSALDKVPNEKTEAQKEAAKRAVYALNMCTVSVSQIVDYQDINILEQEYDAILNNLNLEKITKDEALLHLFRQILDTITYFRMEAGDRKMIEKEYEQKVKNAIWSAVPNFGMIVAGGNPFTMGVSLVSQVGIGYMNYRRNKADYELDKEKQMWKLQRTAIEQLNGLRRELFDTAWRLADTYEFSDKLRLTEKQIERYNHILEDSDEIRKYERLKDLVPTKIFEAYPPFWYFIGNSASYIYGNEDINISAESRNNYRNEALEYYDKFEELNKLSILREDQLASSCALEHIDLLVSDAKTVEDLDEKTQNKVAKLLEIAVDNAGNSFDIYEYCAITYLKLRQYEDARRLLKILVNEQYNTVINAQLLSSVYVHLNEKPEYELLATRVDKDELYPWPISGESGEKLLARFGEKQRDALRKKYSVTFYNYIQKYTIRWNKITSRFELGTEYPDSFFIDTPRALSERKSKAVSIFADREKREHYQEQMRESNYEIEMLDILNEFIRNLFELSTLKDQKVQNEIIEKVKEKISDERDTINKIQQSMSNGTFVLEAYLVAQQISLYSIIYDALTYALTQIEVIINHDDVNGVAILDSELISFCEKNEIPEPAIGEAVEDDSTNTIETEYFLPAIFGQQAIQSKKNSKFNADMAKFIREKMDKGIITGNGAVAFYIGDPEFDGYFYNSKFESYSGIRSHAMMIIKDLTKNKFDLIFTSSGIVDVYRGRVRNKTPYKEVKFKDDSIVIYNELGKIGGNEYKNKSVNINALSALIRELGNKFVSDISDIIEYIDVVAVSTLKEWFYEREPFMTEKTRLIFAFPTASNLEHLGIHFADEIDPDKNLLQCYYDGDSGNIIEKRIVHFEQIETNFQAKLYEHDGMINLPNSKKGAKG